MKTKTPGSFGLPEDLLQEINQTKKKEEKEPEKVEESSEIDVVKEIEELLGITITSDDIVDALFNSSLIKRNVVIIPDKIHATFKYSLTMNETNEIDRKMAESMEHKMLESGYKNLRSQHIAARGILELGKPGLTKSIGSTPDERFEEIGKMSALLIERLIIRWNYFVHLVTTKLDEMQQVKKR